MDNLPHTHAEDEEDKWKYMYFLSHVHLSSTKNSNNRIFYGRKAKKKFTQKF